MALAAQIVRTHSRNVMKLCVFDRIRISDSGARQFSQCIHSLHKQRHSRIEHSRINGTEASVSRLHTILSRTSNLKHLSTEVRNRNVTTASFQIKEDGKSCDVTFDDGFHSHFHSIWLRQNCRCEQCCHPNGQRLIHPATISHIVKIDSIQVKDSQAHIEWKENGGKGHTGVIPIQYLRDNNYNQETLQSIQEQVKMDYSMEEIPEVMYEDIKNDEKERFKWLKQINDFGVSIVKGVPTELEMVQKVGELIAPVWNSIYGVVFDVISTANPINVAYTKLPLDYHMDLVYFESPPGLQLLHCVQFDNTVEGGESIYLDVFAHAEDFRVKHPEHFQTLVEVPATFQKVHYDRDLPVHIVNQKPHIKLNHFNEIVAVYWAPPFEGPLNVPAKDVERYYEAYEAFATSLSVSPYRKTYKMSEGDLVVFNNIRVLHGRKSFAYEEGNRHLQGCYVNIDFFKSKCQVLNNLYGDGNLVKRVGNQCWT